MLMLIHRGHTSLLTLTTTELTSRTKSSTHTGCGLRVTGKLELTDASGFEDTGSSGLIFTSTHPVGTE